MVSYNLNKDQAEIIKSDKQCIIIKGDRRTGKTFTGCCLMISTLFAEGQRQAFVIVPDVQRAINMMYDIQIFLSENINQIYRFNKIYHRIEFRNGSEIQFLTPTDILSYGFKGYRRPDLIFIDDIEIFDKRTSKRIFAIIKEDYAVRGWNCRFYVTYHPMFQFFRPKERHDRCDALFRLAGSNPNWFRKELRASRMYEGLIESGVLKKVKDTTRKE